MSIRNFLKPERPAKRLTILCDACSIRNNPYLGEQLHALTTLLAVQGVECHYLQDRMGLVEAASVPHEFFLESVRRIPFTQQQAIVSPPLDATFQTTVTPPALPAGHSITSLDASPLSADSQYQHKLFSDDLRRSEFPVSHQLVAAQMPESHRFSFYTDTHDPNTDYIDGNGKVHKGAQTFTKKNYQRFFDTMQSCCAVRFTDSDTYRQLIEEETALARKHIFEDKRFTGWQEARQKINNRAPLDSVDPYYVGLYHTCNTASHFINAINRKIRDEPGLTVDSNLRAQCALDKYPPYQDGVARHYHWTDIHLEDFADANTAIPLPIVKGFTQSTYALDHVIGRGKHLLSEGKALHDHFSHAGEHCMKDRAGELLAVAGEDEYVLLITDDSTAYKNLKKFSDPHAGHCETLCSHEIAKQVLRLYPRLQSVYPAEQLRLVADHARPIAEHPWESMHLYEPSAALKAKYPSQGAVFFDNMLGLKTISVA